ncbi:MAG: hypothetical protein AAFQ40_03465, partial [Cyanobacteria bacterium J06623_5]
HGKYHLQCRAELAVRNTRYGSRLGKPITCAAIRNMTVMQGATGHVCKITGIFLKFHQTKCLF